MALPTIVHSSEQPNLRFGVMAINRCANLSGIGQLVDADVNAKGTLQGLITSIRSRQSNGNPSDFYEYQAVIELLTYINPTDTQANNLTNVRTSGDAHELRFTFFGLITDGLFTDATNADVLVGHPNQFNL
jgi:hypothetical protein